jgi:hypothetical protein
MKCILLVCFMAAGSASAGTMYKCQVNGGIEYSDKPCAATTEVKKIRPDAGPTPQDQARAQMQLQNEIDRRRLQDAVEQGGPQARATSATAVPSRADASQSPECQTALQDYDIESRSAASNRNTAWKNTDRLAAKHAAVEAYCNLPPLPPKPKPCVVTPGVMTGGGVVAGSVVICP